MYSKRGASPIFATVILFVIALTIGFFLSNVGNYTTYQTDVCNDIYDARIVTTNGEPRICQTNTSEEENTIRFIIENGADSDIHGLFLTVVGDGENPVYVTRDYEAVIRSSGTISKIYPFPKNVGNAQQVKIALYKKIGERLYLCNEQALVVGSIPHCE